MQGLKLEDLETGKVYKCLLTGMSILVYKLDLDSNLDRAYGRYYDGEYRQTSIKDGQLSEHK